ncbi:MAG: gfo/Idh/MocA family oxidoreductase, partial [Armatimonadaceae bacterium]
AKAVRDGIAFIHGGGIGKVKLARALCYKPRNSIGIQPDAPVPAGVDFDLWLGPAPKRAFKPNTFHYNWHWMWDTGAGDLGNQGIHQMDIARWALNKSELPRSVAAFGGRLGYVDQAQTPNTLVAHYDYGDCELVFEVRGLKTDGLSAKGSMPGVSIGDIVYGDKGYVAFTADYNKAAAFDLEGNLLRAFTGGGNHFADFVAAAKANDRKACAAPVLEGHLSSALCHLGNVSYKMGKPANLGSLTFNDASMAEALERTRTHLAANGVDTGKALVNVGPRLAIDSKRERMRDKSADVLCTREYRAPFAVPERI